ncbi:unnamed protein product [Effrenium voratum]|uniref:SMP-LTD domain-containing protein n=1 Tax=Effrenium voratum TaxID=2562239 RepID=A0AA36I3T4_9DINO|nr:unnamed protein product [Effrenium voratum]
MQQGSAWNMTSCCCTATAQDATEMLETPEEPEGPSSELPQVDSLEPHPEPEMSSDSPKTFMPSATISLEWSNFKPTKKVEVDSGTYPLCPGKPDEALGQLLRSLTEIADDKPAYARRSSLLVRKATSLNQQSESLKCLRETLHLLWPRVNAAVERFMLQQVQPLIRESLPAPLRGFRFRRFTFGPGVPTILGINVGDAPCRDDGQRQGVEVRVAFELESDVDIVASVLGIKAGLSYLSMKGSLVVRLEPLVNEIPVVGGLVAYFVDPPEVDFRMSCGPAQVSDWSSLKQLLHSILNYAVSSMLLLPNVIHVPLIEDEDLVDTATLRDAKPLGVLRVTVSKAPASGRLLGWPQVQLKLCGEEWTCPAAQPSCCWESRQPRGKLYLHLQAASDLTAESFFAVAKVGKQKRRSETAKGAWCLGAKVVRPSPFTSMTLNKVCASTSSVPAAFGAVPWALWTSR